MRASGPRPRPRADLMLEEQIMSRSDRGRDGNDMSGATNAVSDGRNANRQIGRSDLFAGYGFISSCPVEERVAP
jgi:hypothetical protein